MTTALALPTGSDLLALFKSPESIEQVLARIEEEARSYVPDISTAKGRKEIASLAHKIARSKTALDSAGKELNAELRERINAVDAERRRIRDRLDRLKAEVRAPLDQWEQKEAERKDRIRAQIEKMKYQSITAMNQSDEIAAAIEVLESIKIGPEWGEFDGMAAEVRDGTLTRLRDALTAAREREAQAAELERLRKEAIKREAEERERQKREEDRRKKEAAEAEKQRIAAEAAEKARREAQEREERLRREAAAREEKLRMEAEQAKRAAEQAKRAAEEQHRDAEVHRKKALASDEIRMKIKADIIAGIKALPHLRVSTLADAMIDGRIPHIRVEVPNVPET